jgi:FKBP-type peptidyl-prolyl cis-trans isomerase FklB
MRTGTGLAILAAIILAMAIPRPAAAAEEGAKFKDDREKASYGIGANIGQNLKRSGMDVDVDILAGAIKDVIAGRDLKMTEQEAREAITTYQQESRRKMAEKNKKEGEEFMAKNKTKEGVKTHVVTLPDGTKAELQYKVITEGTGATPGSNDMVSVNYRGTLINGKEFDSSAKHGGQPAKFQANRVIRGWTEALQMMKVGSKWELYIPSTLAYGDFGSGPMIEPGSTLIFEVELLGIEAPQPPPTPQPLTSDIIKVPSAEELKKGAKIEVLKAEDVEKALKEAAATNKPATDKPDSGKK